MVWQMAIQGKHIVFIKNGSLAARFQKGVCSAGFISISETVDQVRHQSASTPYFPESTFHCVKEELGTSKRTIAAKEK
jgi:hypothetical protein